MSLVATLTPGGNSNYGHHSGSCRVTSMDAALGHQLRHRSTDRQASY